MSDTYLQDFGHLRKQVRARDVHDPMSGANRWDDLQMDIRKPHISQPRRDSVKANRVFRMDDIEIRLKRKPMPITLQRLGFVPSEVGYHHQLVTPKAHTYQRAMAEAPKPKQSYLPEAGKARLMYGSFKEAIKFFVRKARFSPNPGVSQIYKNKIAVLWKVRNDA